MEKVIITKHQGKIILMHLDDNLTKDIDVYDSREKSILGNIYVGRVRDIAKGINGAFVEIEPGLPCYLSLNDDKIIFLNPKKNNEVCRGDLLLVQVKREATSGKAPLVSCHIDLESKYAALSSDSERLCGVSRKITDPAKIEELKNIAKPYITDDYGFVIRTEAINATKEDIENELKMLAAKYICLIDAARTRTAFTLIRKGTPKLLMDINSYKLDNGSEIVTDIKEIYDELVSYGFNFPVRMYDDEISLYRFYRVQTRLEEALDKKVWLKNGGYLYIESTQALTAIDVNTGKNSANGIEKEETFLKCNLEAVYEIARQLRLRGISGMIIVDFVNMKSEKSRERVAKELKNVLAQDPGKATFVDFTKLGLAEITRKRIKKTLFEVLREKQ